MYKICFITTVPMTLNAFVRNFATYLHSCGDIEIYFICDFDEEFAKTLPSYIHYIPVAMERGISASGFQAVVKLRKIFKSHKFDMIQYSTPNASCYAAIAGYLSRVPVRLYCQWGIAFVGFRGIKRKVFRQIEKLVCFLSTWIEPDSQSNLDFCHRERLYPVNKGSVIWNGSASGVNLNKFNIQKKTIWRQEIRNQYRIPDHAVVYVFVGRITADKGINELLSAIQQIMIQDENVFLLMVGGTDADSSIIQSLFKWSLSQERIVYTGFSNQVEKYIAAADIFVLPSYREGFGSSVIEAEAMGVPVIVTDIPGPVNAMEAGHTGLIVKKANIPELYNAMMYLKDHEEKRIEMGNAGYYFAKEKFDQAILFEKLLQDRIKLMGGCSG